MPYRAVISVKTLIAEVNEAVDKGLWDTLRAVEERIMLFRQMADLAEDGGDPTTLSATELMLAKLSCASTRYASLC